MTKEVMELALEALKTNNKEWKSLADSGDAGYWKAEDQDHYQLTEKAIKALEEALKQKENNFNCKTHPDAPHGFVRNASHSEDRYVCECEFWEPPEQDEPVAYINVEQRKLEWAKYTSWETPTVINLPKIPLYTHSKEWVGLTDEEIDRGLLRTNHALQTAGTWRDGVEWATKQLKEKNA